MNHGERLVTAAVVQTNLVNFDENRGTEPLPEKREDRRWCFGAPRTMTALEKIPVTLDLDGELIQDIEFQGDDMAFGECDFDIVAYYAGPDGFRFHADEQAQSTTALSPKGEPHV